MNKKIQKSIKWARVLKFSAGSEEQNAMCASLKKINYIAF